MLIKCPVCRSVVVQSVVLLSENNVHPSFAGSAGTSREQEESVFPLILDSCYLYPVDFRSHICTVSRTKAH
jgi:hypothetical protein